MPDPRCVKQPLSREEVVRVRHQTMAVEHGSQPQRVVAEASQRPETELELEGSQFAAQSGINYARERGMEREAVSDERSILRDALKHTMGESQLARDQG